MVVHYLSETVHPLRDTFLDTDFGMGNVSVCDDFSDTCAVAHAE